jgi:hypothetical protein
LPLLEPKGENSGTVGDSDTRVQAYNFRLCATSDADPHYNAPFPPAWFSNFNRRLFVLEDAIGSHACLLEALAFV